jgi:hypothetical protein
VHCATLHFCTKQRSLFGQLNLALALTQIIHNNKKKGIKMELQTLPTDNIYKFITVLCVFLFIASIYGVVSVDKAYSNRISGLYEKAIGLEAKELNEKAKGQKLSYYDEKILGHYWGQYETQNRNRILILLTLFISILFSIIGIVVGFNLWYRKLQIHLDSQVNKD